MMSNPNNFIPITTLLLENTDIIYKSNYAFNSTLNNISDIQSTTIPSLYFSLFFILFFFLQFFFVLFLFLLFLFFFCFFLWSFFKFLRNAWKGYSGMPKQNAVLSYTYIVSTILTPDRNENVPNVRMFLSDVVVILFSLFVRMFLM